MLGTTGQKFQQTVAETQAMINRMLQHGYNMFELRHVEFDEYDRTIIGWDVVNISSYRPPNTNRVQYRVNVQKSGALIFRPNEEHILYGYVPDTEKNRRLLAKNIYSGQWHIIRLITANGDVTAAQINKEIADLAKLLGVQKPLPPINDRRVNKSSEQRLDEIMKNLTPEEKLKMQELLSGQKSLETPKVESSQIMGAGPLNSRNNPSPDDMAEQLIEKPNDMEEQADPPKNHNFVERPEVQVTEDELEGFREIVDEGENAELIKKKAEDIVHERNSAFMAFIKKETPKGWKLTKEYREVITPQVQAKILEIRQLMNPMEKDIDAPAPMAPSGQPDLAANLA